jgi:hypothetical protein
MPGKSVKECLASNYLPYRSCDAAYKYLSWKKPMCRQASYGPPYYFPSQRPRTSSIKTRCDNIALLLLDFPDRSKSNNILRVDERQASTKNKENHSILVSEQTTRAAAPF